MTSTANIFNLLKQSTQKQLSFTLAEQQNLQREEAILDKTLEQVEFYTSKAVTAGLLANHLHQRSLALENKQHCQHQQHVIQNRIENQWHQLRSQHRRQEILQQQASQEAIAKDRHLDRIETDELGNRWGLLEK